MKIYEWAEADAEFLRKVISSSSNIANNDGKDIYHGPRHSLIEGPVCSSSPHSSSGGSSSSPCKRHDVSRYTASRQRYLRSYPLTKKKPSWIERTKNWFMIKNYDHNNHNKEATLLADQSNCAGPSTSSSSRASPLLPRCLSLSASSTLNVDACMHALGRQRGCYP